MKIGNIKVIDIIAFVLSSGIMLVGIEMDNLRLFAIGLLMLLFLSRFKSEEVRT